MEQQKRHEHRKQADDARELQEYQLMREMMVVKAPEEPKPSVRPHFVRLGIAALLACHNNKRLGLKLRNTVLARPY